MKIGLFDLDLERGTLRRAGQDVHVRAKSFALLAYLARNAGRVVGKDELLDAIWPDVVVTEDSLTQAIRDLRRILGDGVLRTVALTPGWDAQARVDRWAELEHGADRSYLRQQMALAPGLRQRWRAGPTTS